MINHLAFVFPGQGSQSVGMLADLAQNYPLIQEQFALVSQRLGYDLWQLTQEGPEAKLNQTEHTQVAMLTADVAVYNLLIHLGAKKPQMMAGHSLGEYAALVCADALSLPDAAELVAKRGQRMQNNVPLGQGAMAAIIGLTDEQVDALCKQVSTTNEQVVPANFNAIGQVVIAGHTAAVDHAVALANEQGAKLAKIIPVSVPCHCPLLVEAAEAFAQDLANVKFKEPKIAVISNVDLSIYESTTKIRARLKEQLYQPVRWVETIQKMKEKQIEMIIECGPGKVLSGLIKRIDRSIHTASANDSASLVQILTQFLK